MSHTRYPPPDTPAKGPSNAPEEITNAFDEEFVPTSLIGKKIDKWTLSRLLGQGGMSIVYEASHNWLDQSAAIKLLLPDICKDKKALRRFRQEAMAVSQLQHPNIIEVKDFGRDEEHGYFMVIELLHGVTLQQLLPRAPLPKTWLAAIIKQLCDALDATHRAGVIHRDLKPSNVFLSHGDPLPKAKLLDFGVAKVLLEQGQDRITTTGTIVGTPGYLAPEQVTSETLVPATDLYALAILLYQSLCGELPLRAGTLLQHAMLVLQQAPPLIGTHRPALAGSELEALLAKMLDKEPNNRPQTAKEAWQLLSAAFDAFDDPLDQPISYPQIESPERPQTTHKRQGTLAASEPPPRLISAEATADTPPPDNARALLSGQQQPQTTDKESDGFKPTGRTRTLDLDEEDDEQELSDSVELAGPLRTLDLPTPMPSSDTNQPDAERDEALADTIGMRHTPVETAAIKELTSKPLANVEISQELEHKSLELERERLELERKRLELEHKSQELERKRLASHSFPAKTFTDTPAQPNRTWLWGLLFVVCGVGLGAGWKMWSTQQQVQPAARNTAPKKAVTKRPTPIKKSERKPTKRRLSLAQLQQQYKSLKALEQARKAWKQTKKAMTRGSLSKAHASYKKYSAAFNALKTFADGTLAKAFQKDQKGMHPAYESLSKAKKLLGEYKRLQRMARLSQANKRQRELLALLKGSPAHKPIAARMAKNAQRINKIAQTLRAGEREYQKKQWRRAYKHFKVASKAFPKATHIKRKLKACRCAVRMYPWEICGSHHFPKHHPKYKRKK